MLQGSGDSGERAKASRKEMSPPDIGLWLALRRKPDGLKFRKQHPSDPYVADFYCHEARLIVEVDGEAHGCGDRSERDAARDRWFLARGLHTMRIPARAVLADCDAVVRGVVDLAIRRMAEDRG